METLKAEVVVIGAGPGGYAAAFYARDRGKDVLLVERDSRLGGVCLTRGCIPSKALLHATHLIPEAERSAARGIRFNPPEIDTSRLRAWKEGIVTQLAGGVRALADARGVRIVEGTAQFTGPHNIRVESGGGVQDVEFDDAVIAVGSSPVVPDAWRLDHPGLMTSTEALEIESVPARLLVIGAGYIGMELGTVYAALGSQVVVTEALPRILAGADSDLVRPVLRSAKRRFAEIRLETRVTGLAASGDQIRVTSEGSAGVTEELYDRVLVSVGRKPNSRHLGLETTNVELDDQGFIRVDERQRTAETGIYAIGDVTGGMLLAHKASKEARIAVDSILDDNSVFEAVIPAVVFTDPEVAWCGLTEDDARAQGIAVEVARFPWGASGRAIAVDAPDGLTKLVIEPESERILGMGITGRGAGELIGEGVVLIEMGGTVRDLSECVHPHPTLSETLMECAEIFYGTATHAAARKRPAQS